MTQTLAPGGRYSVCTGPIFAPTPTNPRSFFAKFAASFCASILCRRHSHEVVHVFVVHVEGYVGSSHPSRFLSCRVSTSHVFSRSRLMIVESGCGYFCKIVTFCSCCLSFFVAFSQFAVKITYALPPPSRLGKICGVPNVICFFNNMQTFTCTHVNSLARD